MLLRSTHSDALFCSEFGCTVWFTEIGQRFVAHSAKQLDQPSRLDVEGIHVKTMAVDRHGQHHVCQRRANVNISWHEKRCLGINSLFV